jgi:hypothetical protein
MGRKPYGTGKEGLPKNWKEIMLNAGKEGRLMISIIAQFGITKDHHDILYAEYKDYHRAVDQAQASAEAFWTDALLNQTKPDATSKFMLKTAFGYREFEPSKKPDKIAKRSGGKETPVLEKYRVKKAEDSIQ